MLKKGFDTLLIGSGGVLAFAYLGALNACTDEGFLENIKNFGGTSVGSALSLLLSLGYSYSEIYAHVDEFMIPDLNIPEFKGLSLESIPKSLFKFDRFREALRKMIVFKLGYVPTMADHYAATGKEFAVLATSLDLEKNRGEEVAQVSRHSMPNISVIDAVLASCGIPLVFEKVELHGVHHVDGAFVSPCPFSLFPNTKRICIYVFNGKHKNSGLKNLPQIVTSRLYELEKKATLLDKQAEDIFFELVEVRPPRNAIIEIKLGSYFDMLDLNPNIRNRSIMLQEGFEQAREQLKKFEQYKSLEYKLNC